MLPSIGLMIFLMRPDQKVQFVAVPDIGRIVVAVFGDPSRSVGQAIPIASDAVAGHRLAAALSRSAGRPIEYRRFSIEYRRFSEAVLAESGVLRGVAQQF